MNGLMFQLKRMTVYTFTLHVWMDRCQIRRYFGDTQWEAAIRTASGQRLAYKGAVLVKQWFVLKQRTIVIEPDSDWWGNVLNEMKWSHLLVWGSCRMPRHFFSFGSKARCTFGSLRSPSEKHQNVMSLVGLCLTQYVCLSLGRLCLTQYVGQCLTHASLCHPFVWLQIYLFLTWPCDIVYASLHMALCIWSGNAWLILICL